MNPICESCKNLPEVCFFCKEGNENACCCDKNISSLCKTCKILRKVN